MPVILLYTHCLKAVACSFKEKNFKFCYLFLEFISHEWGTTQNLPTPTIREHIKKKIIVLKCLHNLIYHMVSCIRSSAARNITSAHWWTYTDKVCLTHVAWTTWNSHTKSCNLRMHRRRTIVEYHYERVKGDSPQGLRLLENDICGPVSYTVSWTVKKIRSSR